MSARRRSSASSAGRTIKLVIQTTSGEGAGNPLTAPLMAQQKETSPKKAKF